MKKNLIAVILLFTFFSLELKAQESVNAGGGDIKSSDIVISYSVGQVFVEPVAYPEGSLTPGIQQVYPNPATDYLASGVYFLQIADKEQIVKVFKIIKI
ncbi:hypothetical protein FACS1894177_04790 [Bacteroidia bacterium]|nr:hypothetical protein FACS1894177_04790 [Bacteroidia bacterium]